jgi:hypothetical protein
MPLRPNVAPKGHESFKGSASIARGDIFTFVLRCVLPYFGSQCELKHCQNNGTHSMNGTDLICQ